MPKLTAVQLNAGAPYATPDELEMIAALGRRLKAGDDVVMIGAGPGVFALALLEDHPNPPYLHVIEKDVVTWIQTHAEMAELPTNNMEYVLGDSGEVGKQWQGQIALLIVDGDHSYQGVQRDIAAWLPHVQRGGRVFFHDVLSRPGGFNGVDEWRPGEVAKAIQDFLPANFALLDAVGISQVYEKC